MWVITRIRSLIGLSSIFRNNLSFPCSWYLGVHVYVSYHKKFKIFQNIFKMFSTVVNLLCNVNRDWLLLFFFLIYETYRFMKKYTNDLQNVAGFIFKVQVNIAKIQLKHVKFQNIRLNFYTNTLQCFQVNLAAKNLAFRWRQRRGRFEDIIVGYRANSTLTFACRGMINQWVFSEDWNLGCVRLFVSYVP
jgi:hypothetical protein